MHQIRWARTIAAAAGLPGYEVLQYQHSYLELTAEQRARLDAAR